jgi:Fe-S-cluster containining protein
MAEVRYSELFATPKSLAALQSRFACRRCGRCCTEFKGVRLTKAEIRRLGVPRAEWGKKFALVNGAYVLRQPCPYYDREAHACGAYETRPDTCRNFPVNTVPAADGHRRLGVAVMCEAAQKALTELEMAVMTGQAGEL